MLIESSLPKELRPKSISVAIYVINRSPTTSNLGKISPFFQFTTATKRSNNPWLDLLYIFGAIAYVHVPPEVRLSSRKFNNRAEKGHLVGYSGGNSYHIWIPHRRKVFWSAYMQFDETPRHTTSANLVEASTSTELADPEESVDIVIPADEVSNAAPAPHSHLPRRFPIIAPPLGQHTNEELAADLDAAPQLPELASSVCRSSSRKNKGIAGALD